MEEKDYYITEEGYRCFTEAYYLKRGYCCDNGCKHCPYKNADKLRSTKDNIMSKEHMKSFRETKFHKYMNLKCGLYNVIWRFYTHHCPSCGTTLCEFRGVHDTCRKCDLV